MRRTKTSLETVLAQHEELRGLVGDLYGYLERPRPEIVQETAHEWAERLAQKLVHLHDKLYLHFEEEEEAGVLEFLAEEFPHAGRAIEELSEEHEQLLTGLRHLLSAALRYAEHKPPRDQALRRRTTDLLARLARHEERETELIQKLQWQDLGGGD